jgi:hypothetical protein
MNNELIIPIKNTQKNPMHPSRNKLAKKKSVEINNLGAI